MCGIAGVYCFGNGRLTGPELRALLLDNEHRGKDASGIAYWTGTELVVRKDALKATDFAASVGDEEWDTAARASFTMLHTRARTKGSEKINANNHPVIGFGWAVTHNGMVSNDDDLWKALGGERFAEVDTSAIPLVLHQGADDYMASMRWLSTLGGSTAAALWTERYPASVALVRVGGNPIYLAYDQARELVIWSSAGENLNHRIPGPRLGPIRFTPLSLLADDTVWVLRPSGQNTLFKVDRKPFFRHRRVVMVPPTTPVTRGPGTPGSTSVVSEPPVTRGTSSRPIVTASYKWIPTNAAKYPNKPIPMFDTERLTWQYCRLKRTLDEFNEQPADIYVERWITTPYGRWTFRRQPRHETVVKSFAPSGKEVKRFYRQLTDTKNPLPVRLDERGLSNYDGLLILEPLLIREEVRGLHTTSWETRGYVCPWCGVWQQWHDWNATSFRCAFCNIRSQRSQE